MLLRDNILKMNDKKGVSIMVGYVLLIGISVVISGFVYMTLKSYVPVDEGSCAEGVSLVISKVTCLQDPSSGEYVLEVSLKNNGRFDIGGYHIHGTVSEDQEVATRDLSGNFSLSDSDTGYKMPEEQTILFVQGPQNSLSPSETRNHIFWEITDRIYSIDVTPVRFEEINNRARSISCGEVKTTEKVVCQPIV